VLAEFSHYDLLRILFKTDSLLKKSFFTGCSKMPLPSSRKAGLAQAGRSKLSFAKSRLPGAPEILCRECRYAFPTVLQQLALLDNILVDLHVYQVPKYAALLPKN
jgi:hypothetical protein